MGSTKSVQICIRSKELKPIYPVPASWEYSKGFNRKNVAVLSPQKLAEAKTEMQHEMRQGVEVIVIMLCENDVAIKSGTFDSAADWLKS